MAQTLRILPAGAVALLAAGCSTDIQINHDPLVATSQEEIVFTANAITNATPDTLEIQMLVNAIVVKTCHSSPCTYTGGPYPTREDGFVTYAANVTATYDFLGLTVTQTDVDGYYSTGITDAGYDWRGSEFLYGRVRGDTADKEDLVFHMAQDYADNGKDFSDFVSDATDKVNDVFARQALIERNLDVFNFWVYKKEAADANNCGIVHDDASGDMPWRDDDAILHDDTFGDCTNPGLTRFSAEGSNTKAFLHEAGHAVFGLGDEYNGRTNYTIVQSPEPNIFGNQHACRNEQIAKNRDPDECYQFTPRSGGWWGTHQGVTVMTNGMVGDAWETEAEERVNWYFDQF